MTSDVQIANLALSHLGNDTITSLTSDHPSASTISLFWDLTRDDVLREHKWPFSTAIVTLASLDTDIPTWTYFYGYPSNCLKIWTVFNDATLDTKEEQDFEILFLPPSDNRLVICSNIEQAYAEYSYKVQDVTIWDPKFSMAFSYRLAANIAPRLCADDNKAKEMMNIYSAFMLETKRVSAGERSKKRPEISSGYVDSRG